MSRSDPLYGPHYGAAYRKARAALLAGSPPCHWCGKRATTADHVPSIAEVGFPHLNLVPSCARCNFSRGAKLSHRNRRPLPAPSRDW